MNKKYQVFVSSTYEDLQAERIAVFNALLDCNCIPVGMEQFPATALNQWELIKKMIGGMDYYLLITAGRYGSIEKETGISYTEKEYNYAKSQGIPILAFLHESPNDIPNSITKEDDKGRKKLKEFRDKIKASTHVNFFNTLDDLKYKVFRAVPSIVNDFPRVGWIRADQAKQKNEEYISSVKQIQEMFNNMQKVLSEKIESSILKWEELPIENNIDVKKEIDEYFENKTLILNGGNAEK